MARWKSNLRKMTDLSPFFILTILWPWWKATVSYTHLRAHETDSYLHKIAVPNRFIRIAPNGRISYSQRLTVTARCQMNLRKFPLDTQACPLEIGSFGFDDDHLTYRFVLMLKSIWIAQAQSKNEIKTVGCGCGGPLLHFFFLIVLS